jgi:hypothetical protein
MLNMVKTFFIFVEQFFTYAKNFLYSLSDFHFIADHTV